MKTEQIQEVRVTVDISICLSTKYDANEVWWIVRRGVRHLFPNNDRRIHSARFAEEHEIYSTESGKPKWTDVVPLPPGGAPNLGGTEP